MKRINLTICNKGYISSLQEADWFILLPYQYPSGTCKPYRTIGTFSHIRYCLNIKPLLSNKFFHTRNMVVV